MGLRVYHEGIRTTNVTTLVAYVVPSYKSRRIAKLVVSSPSAGPTRNHTKMASNTGTSMSRHLPPIDRTRKRERTCVPTQGQGRVIPDFAKLMKESVAAYQGDTIEFLKVLTTMMTMDEGLSDEFCSFCSTLDSDPTWSIKDVKRRPIPCNMFCDELMSELFLHDGRPFQCPPPATTSSMCPLPFPSPPSSPSPFHDPFGTHRVLHDHLSQQHRQ